MEINTVLEILPKILIIFLILFYVFLIVNTIKRRHNIRKVFIRHMHEGALLYATPEEGDAPYLYSVFYGMFLYGSSYREFFKYARIYLRRTPVILRDIRTKTTSSTILKFNEPKKNKMTFEILDANTYEHISQYTVCLDDNCDERFLKWIDHFTEYKTQSE